VPDVLRSVILDRTCLPLREYYELVLKAKRAGVLKVSGELDPDVRARRWVLTLSPWIPILLGLVSVACALFCLATRPFPLPGAWPNPACVDLLIGWGLLSLGLSIGQVMAASVLRAGGGEIYDPSFRLLRPVPYFEVNLEDAAMTNRLTQVGIWCALLFPVSATAAALWYYHPSWGLPHVLGLLVMLRPFASGCVSRIISTVCRGLVLDTQKNLLFSLNQRWHVRLQFGLSRISIPYVAARLAWGVAWTLLVIFVALRAADQSMEEVFGSTAYWRDVGGVFGVAGIAIILAYIGVPVSRSLWTYLTTKGQSLRTFLRRWRVKEVASATEEQVSRVLTESLLFRRIAAAERADLRERGTLKVFKGRKTIHTFSDKSTEVGVVISGRLLVSRRLKSGRAEKAFVLQEGDVFGAHALLDPERQHALIKTLTPVVALMIPIDEFEQRLLRTLGASLINDLVHKVPFLRDVSFCQSWHPQAIARFAQLTSTVAYHDGEVILVDRQDTQQFYVVYEGRVTVKRLNRVRARLKPGAYFGEISILQNSSAISDVVATAAARCLLIGKADFLRFVTHNPLVSLQLEQISSQRLGHPIFPLSALSFEIR
jgi:CRP-like cAMP-binding protein